MVVRKLAGARQAYAASVIGFYRASEGTKWTINTTGIGRPAGVVAKTAPENDAGSGNQEGTQGRAGLERGRIEAGIFIQFGVVT